MIPQGFIQDLLARADIVDVVGRHVSLKRRGQNYVGLCPFHSEKTPSFTVSPSKQFFHCFGCGAHGSAIGFLMDLRGLSYVEAVRELAQQVGMTVPEVASRDARAAVRTQALLDLLQQAATFYRRQLKAAPAAINYLKARGLTGATAARFALGYAPVERQALREVFAQYDDAGLVEAGLVIIGDDGRRFDRFRGRVMFPIRNRRGAVVGFGARALDGSEPKYLNSPETPLFRKGQELYGLFEAQEAIRRRRRVIVCEGYLDVIQLAQAGFEETVAALGTAITVQQLAQLFRLADHVIFAFDGDAAGHKAARRALEAALPAVSEEKRASFVLLPEGEDPDSFTRAQGPAAFEQELTRALPLSRFFVRVLCEGRDLRLAEDRAALVAQARPLLASMTAPALRAQLIRELVETTGTSATEAEHAFGLPPWRRLPPARATRQAPPVYDLRQRILKQLIAYPILAREFNAPIAAEFLDSDDPLDRQIVAVWRVARERSDLSSAALLETLTDSEHAAAFQMLAAQELLEDDDLASARAEVAGAFAKLELRRTQAELEALVRAAPTPAVLARIRELTEQQARLKEKIATSDWV
ncbi:MAG: DNA primase [Sutterellaceae bacterium]|nr:DNA primase [Burkholderiaceae bacterium]MCX7900815.1 DNA primase [Burkholderiaceae bacterium]MDW8430478.1 DNA primase [Sutterellaceae bacterium]